MPELVRLYIRNIILGFVLAVLFTAALIGLDVAHLRHLVMATQGGWIAVMLLVVFNTIVFAGVQFAIAVMRMAEPEDKPRSGLRAPITLRPRTLAPALVPVRSTDRDRIV
ncbi:MAG TPA: hypothetical protein PLL33_01185 [Paracoccus sp. (in: a-proteobacteria)]|nr:hypothetical protein [Paracoccus sp. (in: a-proteobacteria)]